MSDEEVVPAPELSGNLRDVLMAIRAKRGALSAEIVLQEATDPEHPLHHRFDWDDSVAAHRWRLHQAGNLLRVKYKTDVGSSRGDLRAFWVTKGPEAGRGSQYSPIEEVISDPVSREIMLRQMRRDWMNFRHRYMHMSEFVEMVTADIVTGDGNGNGADGDGDAKAS